MILSVHLDEVFRRIAAGASPVGPAFDDEDVAGRTHCRRRRTVDPSLDNEFGKRLARWEGRVGGNGGRQNVQKRRSLCRQLDRFGLGEFVL
jgi:hypothetical protein